MVGGSAITVINNMRQGEAGGAWIVVAVVAIVAAWLVAVLVRDWWRGRRKP